ncbi:MAG TPA: hypothetical protein VF746_15200, partial [Longimicrobium sp.]
MRRLATSALAAALVVAGAAGNAVAQDDMVGRRASLFDLGIYAGGAWTSDWFTTPEQGDEEEGWAVGFGPIFGAQATYWLSPTFGIRLNGAYMPTNLPEAEDFFPEDVNDDYVQNNWFYDLDLVWRPLFWSNGGFLGSLYLFAGGGGLTTNIAGETPYPGCQAVPVWIANGVCLSDHPKLATVGQGVLGLGVDAFSFGPSIGVFLEGAVHGYDSPAHVAEQGPGEDKFAFTPRLVLGLKFMFGDILPPPPPPPPPAVVPPPPPPPAVIPPPPPPPPTVQTIRVCVIDNNALTEVEVQYDPATGDTTVAGQRFSERFPVTGAYAANATWFINNEPITFNGRQYAKYGLPRVLGVTEVNRIGEYQGVGVFAETGAT